MACIADVRVHDQTMLMLWDEAKRQQNLLPEPDGHGLDFADARDRFEWKDALTSSTHPGADGRSRFKAIGFLDGDLVTLVFSPLGSEAISAISLRPAARAERKLYARF